MGRALSDEVSSLRKLRDTFKAQAGFARANQHVLGRAVAWGRWIRAHTMCARMRRLVLVRLRASSLRTIKKTLTFWHVGGTLARISASARRAGRLGATALAARHDDRCVCTSLRGWCALTRKAKRFWSGRAENKMVLVSGCFLWWRLCRRREVRVQAATRFIKLRVLSASFSRLALSARRLVSKRGYSRLVGWRAFGSRVNAKACAFAFKDWQWCVRVSKSRRHVAVSPCLSYSADCCLTLFWLFLLRSKQFRRPRACTQLSSAVKCIARDVVKLTLYILSCWRRRLGRRCMQGAFWAWMLMSERQAIGRGFFMSANLHAWSDCIYRVKCTQMAAHGHWLRWAWSEATKCFRYVD